MGTDTEVRSVGTSKPSAPDGDRDRRIDPRIHARRLLVQRDEDRRRWWRCWMLLAAIAIIGAPIAALRSPLLDVDHVIVRGARQTPAAAIAQASGARHGDLLVQLSLGSASRQVADLPWVLEATVRRRWPDTVRITVTERQPLAQIRRAGGGWLVVDRTGRLLSVELTRRPGLVSLGGVEAGSPGAWVDSAWQVGLAVVAELPADLRWQVRSIRRDRRGTGLVLVDGAHVVLGGGDQLGPKFAALRTLLAQPDRRCFATINIGVASAPALTRRPECA